MKLWHLSCAMMAVGLACGTSQDKAQSNQEKETGTLELALIGNDSKGNQYRLRNGEFEVQGYPDYYEDGASGAGSYYYDVLSSEEDLSSPVIKKRVIPGYYDVNFISYDWYFEKLTPAGPERVDKAVLLSSRYRSGYVYDGRVTNFSYVFGVDGELIDFRSGDLQIGIQIERPDDNGVGGGGAGGTSGEGGSPGDVVDFGGAAG